MPVSTRTMYGTVRPFTVAVARSAGRAVGSASGSKAPDVLMYSYDTWVGAAQSGICAAARPKAVVWQKNGSCCLPEKTGPLME